MAAGERSAMSYEDNYSRLVLASAALATQQPSAMCCFYMPVQLVGDAIFTLGSR